MQVSSGVPPSGAEAAIWQGTAAIQKTERLLCIYVKYYTVLMDLMAEPLSPMSILFADHKVI
jgi:hypothetical protein